MRKEITLLLLLIASSFSVSAVNLTMEIQDSNSQTVGADLEVQQDNSVIKQASNNLESELNSGENYTLIQEIDEGPDVEIYNFSIDQNFDFRPTLYQNQSPQKFLIDLDPLYYIDQSINFSEASLSIQKDQPTTIAKCNTINNGCSNWQTQGIQGYNTSYAGGIFEYNVTSFSGYTSGTEAPQPSIENIQIFNVTSQQDRRTGGTLLDEGLNKTFDIGQKNPDFYRFEFNVSNNGSSAWNLSGSDILAHRGLNSEWNVNDIYYRINQQVNEGGTFSNGDMEWNTSENGDLEVNDSLSAEYVVNISDLSSNIYDQEFEANTTDTWDVDNHILDILVYGEINASIDRPENDSVVQNNRVFTLNGTLECLNGDCGDVSADARRNTSSGQELSQGQEFDIIDSNSTCTLLEQQSCTVEWDINATGDDNTFHEIDFNASSEYGEVSEDNTEDTLVEIRDILITSLDYDVVDFGLLDPGEEQNPAENNSVGYNLTVEEDSNTVDNLWIKASNLTSEQDSSYQIPYYNMSYNQQNQYPGTPFTEDYSLVNSSIQPGAVKTFYYWLDVPYGILKGEYSGTITFKANQSAS